MNASRHTILRELFDAAMERQPEERLSFVRQACNGDPAMLEEVQRLIQAHREAGSFIETPAASPAREMAEQISSGGRIGPYLLLRELGRGGMGTVYLAVRSDDAFRKIVALKIVRPGHELQEYVRRFREERQILAALDHPNIARILDGGNTDDGFPYYVMDFVDGSPIGEHCDRSQLGLNDRLRLFQHVCAAVQYLHEYDRSLLTDGCGNDLCIPDRPGPVGRPHDRHQTQIEGAEEAGDRHGSTTVADREGVGMRRNVGVMGTVIAVIVSTYLSIVHRPEAMPELDELIIWFLPLALTGVLWIVQEFLVMRKLKNIQAIATALREKFNLDDTIRCDVTMLLALFFLQLDPPGDPGVLLWFLPAAIVMVSWIVQIIRTVRMVARVERDMVIVSGELGAEGDQKSKIKDQK